MRGLGIAQNIATLLSIICTTPTVIVFLALVKAFEPASPIAIQEPSYIWESEVDSYFKGRTVRFHMPLENGTPQDEILSPALFNSLVLHPQHTASSGVPDHLLCRRPCNHLH